MPHIIPFPNIDPALFSVQLFGIELAIRWYALAYIAGLLLGWRYVVLLARRPALWGGQPAPRATTWPWGLSRVTNWASAWRNCSTNIRASP